MGAMSEDKWGCNGGAGQEGRTLQDRIVTQGYVSQEDRCSHCKPWARAIASYLSGGWTGGARIMPDMQMERDRRTQTGVCGHRSREQTSGALETDTETETG